jgi:hypothetical protein
VTAQQALAASIADVLKDPGAARGPELERKRVATTSAGFETYRAQILPAPEPGRIPNRGPSMAVIAGGAIALVVLFSLMRGGR